MGRRLAGADGESVAGVTRAKIVVTLGPASASPQRIRQLVDAGMDVARLNLSHGSHTDHEAAYAEVRRASDDTGRSVGVLVDLQGPKIRLGRIAAGPVTVAAGDELVITTDDVPGDRHIVSTTYAGLPDDVHPGDRILIDDGRVTLTVTAVAGRDVTTHVVVGGQLSDHKGLNLPDVDVSAPALTDKDIADLRWALRLRADLVALSFVRSRDDIAAVHRVMDEVGVRLPVLAKVEKPQAAHQLADIVDAFDGIMVARGDLGVEMPLEQVPLVQKDAVRLARAAAKPVIVATQMLESMVHAARPTRAETSDVANAVLDGADAVMLSEETSVGDYPVETVTTMARILATVDAGGAAFLPPLPPLEHASVADAITTAAAQVGASVGAQALVAFTQTGDTARRLARHRSPIPVLAFTPTQAVRSQLSLTWGVETFLVSAVEHTDDMVRLVDAALIDIDRLHVGDPVVIVAGSPPGIPGSTNALRVHRIGDAVAGAAPAYRG
jgi:pyruvate kinase